MAKKTNATNLNIRVDKDLKRNSEELFSKLGLNMTTACNMFLREAVRENGIPFKVGLPKDISSNALITE